MKEIPRYFKGQDVFTEAAKKFPGPDHPWKSYKDNLRRTIFIGAPGKDYRACNRKLELGISSEMVVKIPPLPTVNNYCIDENECCVILYLL